jgi:Na+-transporting NADH:ubiquinone oxidoreductase subunit A
MKIRGGFLPRISGRPSHDVEAVPVGKKLYITLKRGNREYSPVVKQGHKIGFGEPLAECRIEGGILSLPAPATGKAVLEEKEGKNTRIILENVVNDKSSPDFKKYEPWRITSEEMRAVLARAGIWPYFWSSRTGEIPSLIDPERPRAIIVTAVIAEPFRARGKVILQRSWSQIIHGIKYLQRLQSDYGTTHIILTEKRDPVARKLYTELAGFAWLRFNPVPLLYPVENPRILEKAIRRDRSFKKEDIIWIIDVQGVAAIGACLAEGMPIHDRVLALGGPGQTEPRHVSVRIGTPVKSLFSGRINTNTTCMLRGGLLTGKKIDPEADSIQYDDDAIFFLPELIDREFLSFLRPGFKRTSILPCFASRLTGAPDRQITTSLRGEPRPCIACGLCEKICPAGLMPQILHRYLYREAYDEAEAAGLDLCVECGLCTFVCPSKIELKNQFVDAMEQLRIEHEEALARTQETAVNDVQSGE